MFAFGISFGLMLLLGAYVGYETHRRAGRPGLDPRCPPAPTGPRTPTGRRDLREPRAEPPGQLKLPPAVLTWTALDDLQLRRELDRANG